MDVLNIGKFILVFWIGAGLSGDTHIAYFDSLPACEAFRKEWLTDETHNAGRCRSTEVGGEVTE